MKLSTFFWLAAAGMLLHPESLLAQDSIRVYRPDPNDPSFADIATPYRSSLSDFRSMRDEPVLPWKASNELVGQIGGWRVYAREAISNEPPIPQPTLTAPPKTKSVSTESSEHTKPGMQHGSHK